MNDSEKALEMRAVVDAKYERYARSVAEQLNHRNSPTARNPKSPSTTRWEEWKIHLHEQPLVQCARLEEHVTTACFRLLDGLPADERRTLWLASGAADRANPYRFGTIGSSDLVADLYERVKDLALGQAKQEASFGRGFFQKRDELLPLVREILETLSRRGQFDSETTALLQQLKTTVDSMPEQEPSEFIKLMLCYTANYEVSGGSRTYSLLVSPESFELDLGGHEWTKEIGGDSWSGAHLTVEADGGRSENGDIDEMMQEMLNAAADPGYEVSFERDC